MTRNEDARINNITEQQHRMTNAIEVERTKNDGQARQQIKMTSKHEVPVEEEGQKPIVQTTPEKIYAEQIDAAQGNSNLLHGRRVEVTSEGKVDNFKSLATENNQGKHKPSNEDPL